jgi:hypothetical protein
MSATIGSHVLETLKALYRDSRITKHAHNIASERKKKTRYVLGIAAMVLSVFVATGIIELITVDKSAAIVIKLLTFFSAVCAGALTFLNYEKEAATHLSAVGVYANISRKTDFLIAEAEDNTVGAPQISEIEALMEQYSKANLDYQNCIPTDKDFDKARSNTKVKEHKRDLEAVQKAVG